MPRRSKVSSLPKPVRDWLESALVEGNFSGYEALAAELGSKGYSISKSALHRVGSKIERRLAAIKASTEAAKLIAASSPDDEDAKSEALIALTQHELFEALNNLNEAAASEDAEARVMLMSKATKGIAELVRASIQRKRYASEVQSRKKALTDAAAAAEKAAKAKGISGNTIDLIKREILGLTS